MQHFSQKRLISSPNRGIIINNKMLAIIWSCRHIHMIKEKERILMKVLANTTTNIIKASALRRLVAVLVMHFYNFDNAPALS